MSVAFRRESDEEHKEPKFDQPIPPGPNLVTVRGRRLIEDAVAGIDAQLAGTPDAETRERLSRDLRYWRLRLATAQVAAPVPAGQAGFGSTVRFRLNGTERTITIVGSDEADPATGLIAFTAPLAKALMQAEVGERVDFQGASEAIEVLAIEHCI